jgi:hypothetical protein
VSNSSTTAAGRSRAARSSSAVSFAPCTSPTEPPMNPGSCDANNTSRPSRRARPIITPSSSETGRPSAGRCGLVIRSLGGSHSVTEPSSKSARTRCRPFDS